MESGLVNGPFGVCVIDNGELRAAYLLKPQFTVVGQELLGQEGISRWCLVTSNLDAHSIEGAKDLSLEGSLVNEFVLLGLLGEGSHTCCQVLLERLVPNQVEGTRAVRVLHIAQKVRVY